MIERRQQCLDLRSEIRVSNEGGVFDIVLGLFSARRVAKEIKGDVRSHSGTNKGEASW
jgi:hypothetical protein